MIGRQTKPNNAKVTIKDYMMTNMFCKPKGSLGWLGGQLMSQDRSLPTWVLDLLEINPSDSVLDVGSGPGLSLQLAVKRAYEGKIIGVDLSKKMLEMARHRNRSLIDTGRVELHLGSVEILPFADAVFDKAMTMNSLHLWTDPITGLREIKRTLRKGGCIAVAITRFSYASPAKFESQLIEAGFTDIRIHTGEPGTCATARA
jgi:ubiquinone/menaquinone biosynthesis C-methylase UbiE